MIAFPVFEDNRRRVIEWVDGLAAGRTESPLPSLRAAHFRLTRVRNSARHRRLETGEIEGARYILLTALATFGWRSQFAESA